MPEQFHEQPHHDPFASFREEAQHVNMIPPSEVRRLGDRRRTIRRTGVAGGVAAALALVAVGVAVVGPSLPTTTRDIAGTPSAAPTTSTTVTTSSSPSPSTSPVPTTPSTVTSTPPTSSPAVAAPSWANVPGVALVFPYGPEVGSVASQYEGLGQAAVGMCDPGDPRVLMGSPTEPMTMLTRVFNPKTNDGIGKVARVVGFSNTEAASSAYEVYVKAAASCDSRYAQHEIYTKPGVWTPGAALKVDGSTVTSQPVRASYFSLSMLVKGKDMGRYNDTMVVQVGTRVLLLTDTFDGQDNNCGVVPNNDTMQCEFPAKLPDFLKLLDAGQ